MGSRLSWWEGGKAQAKSAKLASKERVKGAYRCKSTVPWQRGNGVPERGGGKGRKAGRLAGVRVHSGKGSKEVGGINERLIILSWWKVGDHILGVSARERRKKKKKKTDRPKTV